MNDDGDVLGATAAVGAYRPGSLAAAPLLSFPCILLTTCLAPFPLALCSLCCVVLRVCPPPRAPCRAALVCVLTHPQVGNAFVSRRIGLELNFFKGLLTSPIFLIIMGLITAMQVLIMQTPISYIFKVRLNPCNALQDTMGPRHTLLRQPALLAVLFPLAA